MKRFTQLFNEIDRTNKSGGKQRALENYFREVEDKDAAWAIYFLSGKRKKRLVASKLLRLWVAEWAGIPEWLFEESYQHTGDLAETCSLLLPESAYTWQGGDYPLHDFIETFLLPLEESNEEKQKEIIHTVWSRMDRHQCFLYHKMLTGGFRVGVQDKTVQKALAEVYQLDPALIAHRMMGKWQPGPEWYQSLISTEDSMDKPSRPYPFCLAHPLDPDKMPSFLVDTLVAPKEWFVEPKWDGIRVQLIYRNGQVFLWSRGEESVNESFPELVEAAQYLPPGTVLDGEILVWSKSSQPEPFGTLQKRLGRKKVSARMQKEIPVSFLAYDLLEWDYNDLRGKPTLDRRTSLENLFHSMAKQTSIRLSPVYPFTTWAQVSKCVSDARENGIEGVLLKRKDAPYTTGRKRGVWWKWKVDPLTIDVVMIYAQAGHGRRSGLYTDYTFAIRSDDDLLPIAKAYSGLSDKEIQTLDQWIKKNTQERFGPVRSVPLEQVFEIAFDSVRESTRHKAGLALRFPRIIRWRRDKSAKDIDTLETLKKFLPSSVSPE